jgi:hypothetical protein
MEHFAMGKKWEYQIQLLPWEGIAEDNTQSTLNGLGDEGWELVQVGEKTGTGNYQHMYYLKREKRGSSDSNYHAVLKKRKLLIFILPRRPQKAPFLTIRYVLGTVTSFASEALKVRRTAEVHKLTRMRVPTLQAASGN